MLWGAVIVVFSVLGLFWVAYGLQRWLGQTTEPERVICPASGQLCTVEFVRSMGPDLEPGDRLDVASCSVFERRGDVRCDKACMKRAR